MTVQDAHETYTDFVSSLLQLPQMAPSTRKRKWYLSWVWITAISVAHQTTRRETRKPEYWAERAPSLLLSLRGL